MKVDFYTKSVLTVIASCLLILVIKDVNIVRKAHASPTKSSSSYGLVPVNEDGSINVRWNDHQSIDVNIANISTSEELNINIEEIGGGYLSNGGPILVKIKP